MVVKTREKLIEVARQLFAHKGVENTTMNDIAAASDKGRRTIYTYFKNKREIFNAVIERESNQLVERMRDVMKSDLSPEQKIRELLKRRFELTDPVATRHEMLRSFFGRDIKRIERIKKLASAKELEVLREILAEGVRKGVFDSVQAERFPSAVTMFFHGADYMMSKLGSEDMRMIDFTRTESLDFMVGSLLLKPAAGDDVGQNT